MILENKYEDIDKGLLERKEDRKLYLSVKSVKGKDETSTTFYIEKNETVTVFVLYLICFPALTKKSGNVFKSTT